jgi:hypothetical protein
VAKGRRPRHFAAACAAFLLHALAFASLVLYAPRQAHQPPSVTRIFLPEFLTRPEPPPPALPLPEQAVPQEFAESPLLDVPPVAMPPFFMPPGGIPPPDDDDSRVLQGIGRSLACRLGNLENLSGEEKTRCAEKLAAGEPPPPFALTERETRLWEMWALEIETRKILPPCNADSANAGMFCTRGRLDAATALDRAIGGMR